MKKDSSFSYTRKWCILSFICLLLPIFAHAQQQKVSANIKQKPLKEAVQEIVKKTSMNIAYSKEFVDPDKKVTLNVKDTALEEALKILLKDTNIGFRFLEDSILLYNKDYQSKSGEATQNDKKEISVSGQVVDENSEPIVGATVSVKGTTNGTITDLEGNYSIAVPYGSTLHYSFVGYKEMTEIANKSQINIIMHENVVGLDDVIVIAYGSVQRKNLIGAVDQVSSKVIEKRPVANLSQALQGAAANLTIQQRSTNPNDNKININIRGISTMSDNTPLIVIDGIISTTSELSNLNPMDIDKVSVLKDAGSAAIYGSRSANGVLLVTTKRGELNEKVSVQFHGTYGIQVPEYTYEPVSGYKNAILRNMADYNAGNSLTYMPEQIQYYKEHGNSEWFLKQILKNAPQQNYNLSVSGGSDKTSYMMSFGYFDQQSNFEGSDFGIKRYNIRSNISTEIKRLKLSSIISYARTEGKDHSANRENIISDAARVPLYPDLQMKAPNGKYLLNEMLSEMNSLGVLEKGGRTKSVNNNINGNFDAEFRIMDGLKLKGTIGVNIGSYHRLIMRKPVDFYLSENSEKPSNTINTKRDVQDYNENSLGLNTQLLIDFNRTFNESHNVTALFGVSGESLTRKANELRKEYTDPDLGIATSETEILLESYNTPNNTNKTSIHSYFGRLGYSFKDKYYAETTFRYDGSSKFASGNRWGFFPSVSGGWRITEESFMNYYKYNIGDIKLRASYGILGNQAIGDYQYFNTYGLDDAVYVFNNKVVSGANYSLANTDLTWEESKTFDIGLDFTLLNSRLGVSLDYYNKITSDILLNPIVPSTFGSGLPSYNAGKVRNRGWEVTVNFNAKTGEFQHYASVNLSDSKNKVLKYGEEQIRASEEFSFIIREGLPINSYYGYKRDGYFQTEEELTTGPFFSTGNPGLSVGDVRYKDIDGNGTIGPEDRVVLGNAFPRYTYGITYNLAWKGFDLGFLIQGVGKRTLGIRGELVDTYHFNWCYTMFEHQLDFWTPDNRNARYPRLAAPGSVSNTNNYRQNSDIYLYNGSYLRMKNLTFGYTLPNKLLSTLGLSDARIYFNAENIFTISSVKFIDPEHSSMDGNMSGGASSGRMYPTPRYFGMGIDIKF